MIPELFLLVSSVCFQSLGGELVKHNPGQWLVERGFVGHLDCVQTVRFSTLSTTEKGETAYRVVPETATVCDLVGHHCWEEVNQKIIGMYYIETGLSPNFDEFCRHCPKRRRKVTKTEFIEE